MLSSKHAFKRSTESKPFGAHTSSARLGAGELPLELDSESVACWLAPDPGIQISSKNQTILSANKSTPKLAEADFKIKLPSKRLQTKALVHEYLKLTSVIKNLPIGLQAFVNSVTQLIETREEKYVPKELGCRRDSSVRKLSVII